MKLHPDARGGPISLELSEANGDLLMQHKLCNDYDALQ